MVINTNYLSCIDKITRRRSPQVSEILRKLQEDPRCNRLPLKSFLVLPFQRITRLKILVEVRQGGYAIVKVQYLIAKMFWFKMKLP